MPASNKKTPGTEPDVPRFFRHNIEVANLEEAARFYSTLLALEGRRQALYFTVRDLEAAFERTKCLGCLSRESVHDAPGGGIVVRPRPWGSPLGPERLVRCTKRGWSSPAESNRDFELRRLA